jgi:CRP/FNR family transcriptional regulator
MQVYQHGHCLDHPSKATGCASCLVRQTALCAALKEDDIQRLEKIMRTKTLSADELLVEQGSERHNVYTVTKGMLRLYSELPDGRRQISGFLMPGDYLGLADEDFHSQTVDAVVPSTLCAFKVRDMDHLMDDSPELRDRLFILTRDALRQARESQMMLGRLAPVEKLASFLLILSARLAKRGHTANPVPLEMNRTDIADHLGLTIETVSRSFTKLKMQGLIHLPEPHLVEICNVRSLTAVAGMELNH